MKEKEKKRKEEAAQLGASTSIEIPTQPAHIHTGNGHIDCLPDPDNENEELGAFFFSFQETSIMNLDLNRARTSFQEECDNAAKKNSRGIRLSSKRGNGGFAHHSPTALVDALRALRLPPP